MNNILQRNNVHVSGNPHGPALVFAHGFGGDQTTWRLVAPAFEATHKVVLFDYVGSGQSDIAAWNVERYGNLNGYAQDIIDVCRALQLRNVTLVGHSVSSMISVLATIKEPGLFTQVVMIGPSACYIDDEMGYKGGFSRADMDALMQVMDSNFEGWAAGVSPIMMKNPNRPELTEALRNSILAENEVIAKQFAKIIFYSDHRFDLPKVTVPCLILQSADDAISPPEAGQYLERNIAGSRREQLEAEGHCPHISAPEEVIRAMKAFVMAPMAAN